MERIEKEFEEYASSLQSELTRLCSYVRIAKYLAQESDDRLDAKNIAPAFFNVVSGALFTSLIVLTENLFGKTSECSFLRFLNFVEANLHVFRVREKMRRGGYERDHWVIRNSSSITINDVETDRTAILDCKVLDHVRTRRDKFHAHFDKGIFFDRKRLSEMAPLTWSELEQVVDLGKLILNRYACAYNGIVNVIMPLNVLDIEGALSILQADADRRKKLRSCS